MAATDVEEGAYPPEIIGYAEPWIVAPGDSVEIKVSCTEPEYKYRTVRLIQGIDLPHSPKKVEEEIQGVPRGQRRGRFQAARPGSYGHVPSWGLPIAAEGLQISFYMQPWLLDCRHAQTLISTLDSAAHAGFAIALDNQGALCISVGIHDKVEVVNTGLKPQEKTWSKIKLVLNNRSVQVSLTHISFKVESIPPPAASEWQLDGEAVLFRPGPLLIAATRSNATGHDQSDLESHVTDFFNGRIDGLTVKTCGQRKLTLAKYDFSMDMSSDHIIDVSGRGHHGVLFNAPTRAMKGHDWDGSECDWTRANSGYGAIHFHEDDLDDAAWDTDFVITIPSSARSGAYAVEVEAVNGRDSDTIIFFVRPTRWASDNSNKVCLIFSTFTYLAYANERMYDTTRQNTADLGPGFDIDKTLKSAEFYKMRRRRDLGLSCYDRHNDGSGVCYSSSKRPILNVRPGYIMWAFSHPRPRNNTS